MKRSLYIFFCAFFSIQVSYGMLQKRPCNKQTISNKPICNLPTEYLTQLQVQAKKIPQLKICLCEKTSLVKTREIISSTSSLELNTRCSANQRLFVRFFALIPDIAHLIIKDICENNPQLMADFYKKPIKMLEYRSLMQDKLNNDKKLASVISLSELCLAPKEAIIALFDLTKHFKHNSTQAFVLDRQTIAHLCNLKQAILSFDYFRNKLVIDENSINTSHIKYSFTKFINYCCDNHTYKTEHNIKFYVCESKDPANTIACLPHIIAIKESDIKIKAINENMFVAGGILAFVCTCSTAKWLEQFINRT